MHALTLLTAANMPRGAIHPVFGPDGRLLRYEDGPDTVIFDLQGGGAIGRFQGSDAVWSPDGGWLALVRGGNVCVGGRVGERARAVGHGRAPQWDRAGKRAFWYADDGERPKLLCARPDGSNIEEFAPASWSPGTPWALSPDGCLLAYTHLSANRDRLMDLPAGLGQIGYFPDAPEVRVHDFATGRDLAVETLRPGAEVSFSWSPDGRILAVMWDVFWGDPGPYDRGVDLWRRAECRCAPVNLDKGTTASCVSWSPCGCYLALLVNPGGRETYDPFGHLAVYDVRAGRLVWTCEDVLATYRASWAPDGKALYFRSARHIDQPCVAISADGGNLRRVTPEGYYSSAPVVSPDGNWIAVFARSFSSLGEIWLCSVGGGEQRCITSCSQVLTELDLPSVWTHSWTTEDGLEFDGIVIDPPGGRSEDAPILVWTCVSERGWAIVDLEPETTNCGFLLQSIAQQGFRVFIPSHRLTGLAGLEHVRDHFLHAGMAADVVSGIRSLKQEFGSCAPVVSFGQSTGGGITWEILMSYPEVFSAAVVTGAGGDYGMIYGMEGRPNLGMRKTFGGAPWESPHRYFDASPMRGVERIACPVLIMMGSKDEEVPSARQFFVALREAGKDATFLLLSGAHHWPEGPKQVATYVETAVRWLQGKVRPGTGA